MVARDGIEPPTPAFSGLRSTPELPGRFAGKAQFTRPLIPLVCPGCVCSSTVRLMLFLIYSTHLALLMGEKRLGDVIDDHCIKCRRITNHSIVSLVEGQAAKVRCRTCYHDHDYRHEQAPPSKKELKRAEAEALAQASEAQAALEAQNGQPVAAGAEAIEELKAKSEHA